MIRRLDHVAVAVRDTEKAVDDFRDRLGLKVVASEVVTGLSLRLTYLDAGNAYLQLVEPLTTDSPIAIWLDAYGEGLHHICFGVDDVKKDIANLSGNGGCQPLGSGRGRPSGFLHEEIAGVRVECTAFDFKEDVQETRGFLECGRNTLPGQTGSATDSGKGL